MSIYTKKGDSGKTSLVGGVRVNKSDIRVDAYGTIDELNASVSLASKVVKDPANIALLEAIQHQLFYLGAEVATAENSSTKTNQRLIDTDDISVMEQAVDRCMAALPPVRSFVLPGSSEVGSRLHVSRTIARRAERRLVALTQCSDLRPVVLKYVNRLSDLLYALARYEDHLAYTETLVKTIVEKYTQAVAGQPDPDPSHKSTGNSPMATSALLGFGKIHQIMKQAVEAAIKHQIPVVISVVDAHGNLIMTYRMPDALLVSSELAPKKAYTAVALKSPTHLLSDLIQPGGDLFQLETSCEGKIVTFGGGFPLYINQKLVGAIGISGGSVEQDMDIAQSAIHGLDLEEK